ncbi:MAG: NAD-dependent malic enzyme [Alteromonadaceae bacterium]|nr:MAG: NAD-dependent malic enzyme [Alteromonadaceae bacterium]
MKDNGMRYLKNPRLNKGIGFTLEERKELGLGGILPPIVCTMDQQADRALLNIRRQENDIDRYVFLSALQKRNERLFYRVLIDHIHELMPYVYTPTVGQACQEFASIFRETSGFYISLHDRGNISELLDHWPEKDIRLIVATDGERILGLGDLGANGMGIPIGKLALYCACAGVHPEQCLPIVLDVGTENDTYRDDPMYLGSRERRTRGAAYNSFIDEFVNAVKIKYPKALLQFEDFATPNAVALLERYRDKLLCFNDDIQGTAAVALAGLYASTRINGKRLKEMRFMFCGAGSAATGIGHLLIKALQNEGLSEEQAYRQVTFVDKSGLVIKNRNAIPSHVVPFAKQDESMGFLEAINTYKPNALIGATGAAGIFSREIIGAMSALNDDPVIFALSNPTSNAECTAEDVYAWSDGRAIFASGSPFGVVYVDGKMKVPGQGNNAYIFPGLGLGAIACGATEINDDMLIASANILAGMVSQNQIDQGCLYPPLSEIREVSVKIAVKIAELAQEGGHTKTPLSTNFEQELRDSLYDPRY